MYMQVKNGLRGRRTDRRDYVRCRRQLAGDLCRLAHNFSRDGGGCRRVYHVRARDNQQMTWGDWVQRLEGHHAVGLADIFTGLNALAERAAGHTYASCRKLIPLSVPLSSSAAMFGIAKPKPG